MPTSPQFIVFLIVIVGAVVGLFLWLDHRRDKKKIADWRDRIEKKYEGEDETRS